MDQTCTLKYLEPNENLFMVLDGWIKKYNTSPLSFQESKKDVGSLSIKWNQEASSPVENDNTLESLKEWAIKNKKVVIVTTTCISVFASSVLIMNASIAFLRKLEKGNNISILQELRDFRNVVASSEITPGVYYLDESNKVVVEDDAQVLSSEIESNDKGDASFAIPGSEFNVNSFMKRSINQLIGDYMQDKMQGDDSLSQETISPEESSIEAFSIDDANSIPEDPVLVSEVVAEASYVLNESGGSEIVIPSSVRQTGLCRNYTSYSYYYGRWSKRTMQRELSEQWGAAGKPSSNGIATLNGRYLVAVSPKFGKVGDNIDIVLVDGQVINATIADMKGPDATSEWGHVLGEHGAVDIIEWEASGTKEEINLGTWKNVHVEKIINLGKASEAQTTPVYEETPEVEIVTDETVDAPDEVIDVSDETESIKAEEQQYDQLIELYDINEGQEESMNDFYEDSQVPKQKVYTY